MCIELSKYFVLKPLTELEGPEVYESKDMSSLLFNEHAWNKYIIQYCGNIHIEFQISMKLLLLLI